MLGSLLVAPVGQGTWAASAAAAGPALLCSVAQVTSTSGNTYNDLSTDSVSDDGSLVAFVSSEDLTGGGLDRGGVYLFDTTTGTISSAGTDGGGSAVLSSDGTHIAYNDSIDGDVTQVFVRDLTTGTTTQATFGDQDTFVTGISPDGTKVVYLSDFDLPQHWGPFTVNLYDLDTATATMLTPEEWSDRPSDGTDASISPDGGTVAFVAAFGLVPNGRSDLYLYDIASSSLINVSGSASSLWSAQRPRFTDGGATLVFTAAGPVIDGITGNAFHTYHYDLATGTISLWDTLPPHAPYTPSADGSHVAFTTGNNLNGHDPDGGAEVYSYDVARDEFTQLTSFAPVPNHGTGPVASAGDGSLVAFAANVDLTGGNPDLNTEIFVATTCDPAPRPDTKIATARSGPYTGRHLYAISPTPAQKLRRPIRPGATRKFFVRVQNQREADDTFALSGEGAGAPGYQVTYMAGRDDITDQVLDGTYTVGPLGPGESVTVKVKIRAVTAGPGTSHVADLTARSQTNPVAGDTVRAKVTRT